MEKVAEDARRPGDLGFGLWFDQRLASPTSAEGAGERVEGGGDEGSGEGGGDVTAAEERRWANPLQSALPWAPNLTVHCLYGVGKPTERAYVVEPSVDQLGQREAPSSTRGDLPPFRIDRLANRGDDLVNGVVLRDGDGTAPLLSLGYMCASGWRRSRALNPSRSSVTTREYMHAPSEQLSDGVRGGPTSADHVDLLGNHELLRDVLAIVGGRAESVTDRFVSDINRVAQRVDTRIALAHARAADSRQ